MLEFVKNTNDDLTINICLENGDTVGEIFIHKGKYTLNLYHLYGDTKGLRKISDKLDELNGHV